jgi:hypothetical protein
MPGGRPKGGGPTPGSYKPGQTGNPGGRPKSVTEVRELARTYTVQAIETLVEIMQDTSANPGSRVAAANNLLDRGHGKAPQTFEATNYDQMTDAELERRIAEALDGLRALGFDLGGEAGDAEGAEGKGAKVGTH